MTESVFDQWEDESTDDEYQVVEDYLYWTAEFWGNSYKAVTKAALVNGVPEWVVREYIDHYLQVVPRG